MFIFIKYTRTQNDTKEIEDIEFEIEVTQVKNESNTSTIKISYWSQGLTKELCAVHFSGRYSIIIYKTLRRKHK